MPTLVVSPVVSNLARKEAKVQPGAKFGSRGYFAQGNIDGADGRYHVTASAWLVKSKETGLTPKADEAEVAERLLALSLAPKEMKGKPGYWGGGKVVTTQGDVLQVSVIATKIVK